MSSDPSTDSKYDIQLDIEDGNNPNDLYRILLLRTSDLVLIHLKKDLDLNNHLFL